ncbi:hypothetical protein HYPSUDRAFT_46268 [Hypholoma sublateritium FD-334 SS-4]|uniref:Uncharacterized protein n=1 Tax=Hypholoma sublateritium (strain FD-334 SS-4) TaxID=945553 RepID=A0A0D2KS57_HYPSF|nr:hypothetical protein HYPSUDRAFT_46268 [Hypholoma sublateritium FD-334 SS-4]
MPLIPSPRARPRPPPAVQTLPPSPAALSVHPSLSLTDTPDPPHIPRANCCVPSL